MAAKKLITTSRKSRVLTQKNKTQLSKKKQMLKRNFNGLAKVRDMPLCQRVWRKTIVRTKPKPKVPVPRLFRIDPLTGLPCDYERTVTRIMHYVNPHTSKCPCPEHLLQKMLARTLAEYLESCSCSRCPPNINQQIYSILKRHGLNIPNVDEHVDNEELSQFHCACKLGPVMTEPQATKNKTKLNRKRLTMYSKCPKGYC